MIDPVIRPYRSGDRDAMYDVCLRTADAGRDATSLYADPDLMGDLFAGPYAYLAPDFAFVVDNGDRVVGYVVGVPDTVAFVEQWRERWLPLVGAKHPAPVGAPTNPDEVMARLMHWPERMIVPELADYPAHLHIDLLPGYQRSGLGRRLIHTLLDALHANGVPRVHLGMATTNKPARAFYDRVGFHEIPVADAGELTYLGRSTEISAATPN